MAAPPAKTQNLSYEAFFNFAVTKTGKLGGKEVERILSFDFKGQRLNNIEKENVNRTFPFADIAGAQYKGLDLTILMRKGGDYKCQGQSPQDVENICGILNKVAAKAPLELERRDRRVLYAGHVLKYGHSFSGFDNRFLVLVPGKLFVFGGKVGSESYTAFPRNIVACDNAGIALLGDGLSFNLKYGPNCSKVLPLYCPSKEARESWYTALKLSAQKCKGGIPMLPISNANLPAEAEPTAEETPAPAAEEPAAAPAEAPPPEAEAEAEAEAPAADAETTEYHSDEDAPKEKIDYGDGEEGHSEPTEEEVAVVPDAPAPRKKRGSLIEADEAQAAAAAAALAVPAPAPEAASAEDQELAELEAQLKACQARETAKEKVEAKHAEMSAMSDGEKKSAFAFWKELEAKATDEKL